MTARGEKFQKALIVVRSGKVALGKGSKPGQMRPDTLYSLLQSLGWRWSAARVRWEYAADDEPSPTTDLPAAPMVKRGSEASDVFMLRIMAHKSRMPKITAEFGEFAELFDWEVLSVSEPHDNHGDGEFCRVYIRIRIGS